MAEQKIIRKTYEAVETKAAEGEDRTLIVTISTSNPDRSKDIVVPDGMESENYIRNPVVAAFHNYHQPAIGKTIDLQKTENGIIAKVQFLPKGIYPLADQLYEMYKAGFMNAWSIGFIPKERVDLDPEHPWSGGHRFDKWELLEYSAVLVPDNPEALTMLRSKGISDEVIEQGTNIETEVEASKVEKEIVEAAKALDHTAPAEQPDSQTAEKPDGANAITELKKTIARLEQEVTELKTQLTTESAATEPVPQLSDPLVVVPVIRAVKDLDKVIGIFLRDQKQAKSPEN